MSSFEVTENSIMLRRNGLPSITKKMMTVLVTLREAKQAERPYVALSAVHHNTLRSLEDRDWIAESFDLNRASFHYITERGLKALATYEKPTRYRYDGLCPTCQKRPRGQWSNGNLKPYCNRCQCDTNNKQYAFKGHQYKPDGLCPSCKAQPRHVTASGHIAPYCEACRRARRKQERKAKMKRKLWLISIGRSPICCKCDLPVYHSAKTVYDYCYVHYREQQNNYNRRKDQPLSEA